MLTLGIETSCDETSVSVTDKRRVLSNVVSSSVHLHKRYGGVVPEIASRYHVEYILEVLEEALEESKKELEDIELVAVTDSPGLVGALICGISMAKALALTLGIPIIGVNHIFAHLYSSFLDRPEAPPFPFIGLVVSGGHTALFHVKDVDDVTLLGQTEDDAVGESYDKVSKMLSLGYPGGPIVERKALLSRKRDAALFPRSYLGKDSLDFSFSGVKTAVLYYIEKLKKCNSLSLRDDRSAPSSLRGGGVGECADEAIYQQSADRLLRRPPSKIRSPRNDGLDRSAINDICYSFQEAALDVLVHKAFLAARMKRINTIVVGGGVAANRRLRDKFDEAARFSQDAVKVYFPEFRFSVDNAAMVGALGEALYKKGHRSDLYLGAEPNLGRRRW